MNQPSPTMLMYGIKQLPSVIPFKAPTIRKMIAEGSFPAWKVGGMWVISDEVLRKWIRESQFNNI
jgi:excisionase family DNA binding protein